MPAFVIPAIGSALGKLGLGALGRAAATKGAGALVKSIGSAGAKKAAGNGFRRFAGKALKDYMGPGGVTPTNLAVNFGLDAGFGVLQGINTPGDLGDKIIAGTTTGIGGALGGIGAVSALGRHKNNPALRMLGEFGGGYAGDMAGQAVGDTAMRLKGGGTTPYEKLAASQDQEYRQAVEREILASLGLGGYQPSDLINRDRLL